MALLDAGSDEPARGFAAIQTSYDLQAGSYTAAFNTPEGARLKAAFAEALAPHVEGYDTLLDAGVGEATTLAPVLERLGSRIEVYGFDASVSRLLWARRNLAAVEGGGLSQLFVADTAEIPLQNGSIDAVLSVHSLEPNGGRETALLTELLRVAGRRLVLIEPSSIYASQNQIERMRRLGYCMDLPDVLVELGADIALHEPWPFNSNPDNAAEIIVVDIPPPGSAGESRGNADDALQLVAPVSLANLEVVDSGLYSRHDGLYFPVVAGFPILTRNEAVVATQLLDGI